MGTETFCKTLKGKLVPANCTNSYKTKREELSNDGHVRIEDTDLYTYIPAVLRRSESIVVPSVREAGGGILESW